ncbi:hypothetical protein BDR26DRAFT_12359 [Obelidium mucronatum]|nr:hypothetical protein BDR26DRAFT_12359 [Obelidium mucronatum]
MQLDSDPFDDGDVSGGIKAHEAAGHSFEDIVGYVVGERNQLRLQNGQLWKIIEKQRVIMEGLKTEITELKLREETRVLASLSVPDVIGAIESSHQDIPSISELRRSITEHSALELASFRSSGKRVSTYEATVDENEVKAYTGLVDSFLPESEDADPPLRGASLKHKNSFILPSRTSSMMLAYTPSNEDLRHPHPHPQQASILSAFRESTSSNPPSRKSSRPPTPLPPAPQTLNEVPLVSSSNSAPGSSANSRSTTPIPAPLSVTTQPLPQNPLVHSLSLSSEDGIIVRVVGSAFQGTGADGVLFFVLVKKERTNEEWKVEKRYSDFIALDGKLRSKLSKQVMSSIGKPPEKSLFTSMNPVKSDQRKVALEMYLQRVLDAVPDSREMFHFLTTSVSSGQPLALFQSSGSIPGLQTAESTADIDGIMSPLNTDTTILKEGYLMKRGKNFGGWKPRYFRCKPYFLDYSDGPHREFSSTISLKHCHIASIKPAANDTKSAHGLILIEFQKEHFPVPFDIQPPPESKIKHRHILAADSDVDRDDWVSIIFTQIKEARGPPAGFRKTYYKPNYATTSKTTVCAIFDRIF